MRPATRIVHFDPAPGDAFRPSATPLYLATTYEQPAPFEAARFDYARSGNPTRAVLEDHLAQLEGASHAFCFASGLAAITAVTRLLAAGDAVLAGTELYGGTLRLFHEALPRTGLDVTYADASNTEAFCAAIGPATRLVFVETPTNPRLSIVDLESIADACHRASALLCVDNTLLSPYLQNPLAHGADLVVHSATKFLSGHSDVLAGVVATRTPELAARIAWIQNAEGAVLSPFDGYLLLRGLKTLALRIDRQQDSARRVAAVLDGHRAVRRVYWPGLANHPGRAVHERQARGAGSVISFETGSRSASERFVAALSLFPLTVSFGGIGSSVSLPAGMSHASVPRSLRASLPPADLVRLSIGIEDPNDLVEDVVRALDAIDAADSSSAPEACRVALGTRIARVDP